MPAIAPSLFVGVPDLDDDHQNFLDLVDHLSSARTYKQVALLTAAVSAIRGISQTTDAVNQLAASVAAAVEKQSRPPPKSAAR